MALIVFFAALMIVFSLYMMTNPTGWSQSIILFSQKPYFHLFEITSRLVFGLVFVYYASDMVYSSLFYGLGVLLVLVGIGLSVTPPSKHKQFAVWSANRFISIFPIAGCCSLGFGGFLLYVVWLSF